MKMKDFIILSISFITSIGASFGHNFMTMRFIKWWPLVNSCVFLAVPIVTLVQCLTCLVILNVFPFFCGESKYLGILKVVTHILTVLLDNLSLVFLEPSSKLTIKLLEVLTLAFGQRIFQKIKLQWTTVLSLPGVVFGAVMFTYDFGQAEGVFGVNLGIMLVFLSNICMNARNIAISIEINKKVDPTLRSVTFISISILCILCVICIILYLEVIHLLPRFSGLLACTVTVSGILSVLSAYINTYIVLNRLTVLTASLLNTVRKLFVILMLYIVGTRTAIVYNFIGLFICFVGLSIYQYGQYLKRKSMKEVHTKDEVNYQSDDNY